MAHEKHIVDRLSTRLPSLLPEHIRRGSYLRIFSYKRISSTSNQKLLFSNHQMDLEGIRLEDGTSEKAHSVALRRWYQFLLTQDVSRISKQYTNDGKKDLEPFSSR